MSRVLIKGASLLGRRTADVYVEDGLIREIGAGLDTPSLRSGSSTSGADSGGRVASASERHDGGRVASASERIETPGADA